MATFLQWLFGGGQKPEQNSSLSTGRTIQEANDLLFTENQDVMAAPEFIATLQIRTPLAVLLHHGERFDGAPSQAPNYGTEADGIWLLRTKTWAELGAKNFKERESEMASDVGPILASSYLPFLVAFRRIVEGTASVPEKLAALEQLRATNSIYASFWERLQKSYPDFPESFFYLQLTSLPGIGPKLPEDYTKPVSARYLKSVRRPRPIC